MRERSPFQFQTAFMNLLNMKQDEPSMGLSMLAITEHCDLLPKPEYSYKWLTTEINRRKLPRRKLPVHNRLFANSENGYREQALEIINGCKWSWAVVMPVDKSTNLHRFIKLFLFAHDHLKHTLPVVCMTGQYWEAFKSFENENPETITRLESNVYHANEIDTLMLKENWRTGNGVG